MSGMSFKSDCKIEIPYTDFELKLALFGVQNSEERIKEISEHLKKDIPSTPAQKHKCIADHYGISVLDLINSPNFEILVQKFELSKIFEFKQKMVEGGFTEKEAWAIIAAANNTLKFD